MSDRDEDWYSKLSNQASSIVKLLNSPLASSILRIHPNDVLKLPISDVAWLKGLDIPEEWSHWWSWAAEKEKAWMEIARLCRANPPGVTQWKDVPDELLALIEDINKTVLPRDPYIWRTSVETDSDVISPPKRTNTGMSLKKAHEVSRMSSYISALLARMSRTMGREVRHIVDVGAGQGYLSRALHELPIQRSSELEGIPNKIHVLALDSSSTQVNGAKIRSARIAKSKFGMAHTDFTFGTITFRSLCIGKNSIANVNSGETPEHTGDLLGIIGEWLHEIEEEPSSESHQSIPVILVGLHACGSLTPSIFRSMFSKRTLERDCWGYEQSCSRWNIAATVVVGCCYNMLDPKEFPVSDTVRDFVSKHTSAFAMSEAQLQLAAQVPSQWLRSEDTTASTELALRKIVFRAFISPNLREEGPGHSRRLGKLHGSAYTEFSTFLRVAEDKSGLGLAHLESTTLKDHDTLSRRLEVLHTLRCILGPAIESLIVIDRMLWIWEKLGGSSDPFVVRAVNLFDQGMGSGRNIAIVVAPSESIP